jgi:hypothetical protein
MAHQGAEFFHHAVEGFGGVADLVLAADFQAPGEVTLATGNVAQAGHHLVQRAGNEVADEKVDEGQQGNTDDQGGEQRLGSLRRNGFVDVVQGDLHADRAKHRLLRHLVAGDAVLAQIVLRGQRGAHHTQVFAFLVGLDGAEFLAAAEYLLFDVVVGAGVLGVARPEDLADVFTADHLEVANDGQLLDLVEENFALADGAREHHAGQPGHGGLVHG